jgi:dihydroneopterin aldolase
MPPRFAGAGPSLRHVFVRDLEVMTVIGVHDYEKRAAQRVIVNVDLAVAELGPSLSDRLGDVLDYAEVVRGVERILRAGHVNLLETLAERVAEHCLADPRVRTVRVRMEKPEAIPNARSVGIEIERLQRQAAAGSRNS